MLIRQSKNSFIRCTEHYGYISNQLTRHDRVYDDIGSNFLAKITREAQDIDVIIKNLALEYNNVDVSELKSDFMQFAESLARDYFIVLGESEEELNEKDIDFTYSIDDPKTIKDDFYQVTDEIVPDNTQDFFLEEMQGRPLISRLQFELSSRCNERCIHCYIPNEKKNKGFDMPTAKVKSVIDEFRALGGLHVALSGGEAFMHKDLIEIVRYCREKDIKVTILSNLISITDNQVEELKKLNISLIQVSLYSMHPEIHDFITTVKGSFAKTKKAIEKLVAADIPVQISCPVMKANYMGYKEVMDYAKSLKIKAQTDFIMMARADLNTENLSNRLSLKETEILLRDIIEYNIDYHLMHQKLRPITDEMHLDLERFKNRPVCGVGYDNCCIAANGDVYPCAGWQDFVLGNIYKQSLKEVWEESEKIKMLRNITESSFPQCLECEARQYCARCLVRNYNESGGDMFKVNNHFCQVAFLTKRLDEEYQEKFNKLIRSDI